MVVPRRFYRRIFCFLVFMVILLAVSPLFWRNISDPGTDSKQRLSVNHVEFGMGENRQVKETRLETIHEKKHVILLNVHRTGSSILEHILFRFGTKNNLKLSLFHSPNSMNDTVHNAQIESSDKYDIVSIYSNAIGLTNTVPTDAVKIAIIRDPVARIASEVNSKDGEQRPNAHIIRSMMPALQHNSMAKSFGLDQNMQPRDEAELNAKLDELRQEFVIILLLERLEESIILLRRKLGWSFADILFLERDINTYADLKLTIEEKNTIINDNYLDVVLYNFFTKVFDEQISKQAGDFAEEVVHLRVILTHVLGYCNQGTVPSEAFVVDATVWHEDIFISWKQCETLKGTLKADRVSNKSF